jgi:ribose 5-phosphate isomerase RpiB
MLDERDSFFSQHNDANIISIPARYTSIPQAVEMVETFINTAFEGRHQNRVKNRLLDSFIFIKTIFIKIK